MLICGFQANRIHPVRPFHPNPDINPFADPFALGDPHGMMPGRENKGRDPDSDLPMPIGPWDGEKD